MDEQKERSNAEGKSQVGKTCRQNKQKIIEFLFRHKLMFGILATLVLLIGIPFLINVLYMLPIWFPHIPRLVTMWSSSDVLESVLKPPYCRIIHPKRVNIRKKTAKFCLYFKPFRHSRHPFFGRKKQ